MAIRTADPGVQAPAKKRAETAPTADAVVEAKPKRKRTKPSSSPPRVKKTRVKKAPPRICARWVVFDGAMKQVAIFEYRERPAADQKLADMRAKNKGSYFMQIVKEPMPEPEPEPLKATGVA
jgi:hypothetical protein